MIKLNCLSRILTLWILLSSAFADGKVYIQSDDGLNWNAGAELRQSALIDYKDGVETLALGIEAKTEGKKGIWVFPVPAEPNDIQLEINSNFSVPEGEEYSQPMGDSVKGMVFPELFSLSNLISPAASRIFVMRAMVSSFFGSDYSEYSEGGVSVHKKASKYGLTSELISASDPKALLNFFQQKGLILEDGDREIWTSYLNKNYSFVVSSFDRKDSGADVKIPDLFSLVVKFKTEKIYFPLVPSKSYGSAVIPIQLFINGEVDTVVPSSLKSFTTTEYMVGDGSKNSGFFKNLNTSDWPNQFLFTQIRINSEANLFHEDLWVTPSSTASTVLKVSIFNYGSFVVVLFGILYFLNLFVILAKLFPRSLSLVGYLKFFIVAVIGGLSGILLLSLNKKRHEISRRALWINVTLGLVACIGDLLVALAYGLYYGVLGNLMPKHVPVVASKGWQLPEPVTLLRGFVGNIFSTIEGHWGALLMCVTFICGAIFIFRMYKFRERKPNLTPHILLQALVFAMPIALYFLVA